MAGPDNAIPKPGLDFLNKAGNYLLILGFLQILIGVFAIGSSFITTMATVFLFGMILIVGAVVQVIAAWQDRKSRSFVIHLLCALLQGFVGVLMIEKPLDAAAGLTLILAVALVISGALRVIIAVMDQFPSWIWVLLNGVISVVLGVMIWRQWPESSLWIIGLFVGLELLFNGWAWVMFALTGKAIASNLAQPKP